MVVGLGFTVPIIMGGRMMLNVRRTFSDDRHHHIPSSPSAVSLEDAFEEPSLALKPLT